MSVIFWELDSGFSLGFWANHLTTIGLVLGISSHYKINLFIQHYKINFSVWAKLGWHDYYWIIEIYHYDYVLQEINGTLMLNIYELWYKKFGIVI